MADIYLVPLYFTPQYFYLLFVDLLLALEISPFLCLLVLESLDSLQRLIVGLLQEGISFPQLF